MRIGFDEARKTSLRWFPEQMFAFYFGNTAIFLVQNTQRWSLATKCARSSVQTSWTKTAVVFGKDSALPPAPPSETSLGTYTAATSRYLRRVGRPRKKWIPEVFSLALSLQVVLAICYCCPEWIAMAPTGFEPMHRLGPVRPPCSTLPWGF